MRVRVVTLSAGAAVSIAFAALVAQLLLGATQIGVSTDEPLHVSRTAQWFDTGWYLPERHLADGQPVTDIDAGRLHAYGAAYGIYGHTVAVGAGIEQWGRPERTATAYTARGVAVAALGLGAAAAVGYALTVATGRKLVGLWGAASVLALPLWTGYSMFAVKDVPAAAGWTFVTAALVVALVAKPGWGRPVLVGLLSLIGVWFSFGVRTALWVPIATMVVAFGLLVVLHPARRQLVPAVVASGTGLIAGVAAVALLHYRNAVTPAQWLWSSVRTSGDFHWTGTTLTAGRLVAEKPPWWYLPAWATSSLPMLLGLLAVAGVVVAVIAVIRQVRSARPGLATHQRDGAGAILWAQQALLLPFIATVGGATMYAGLRQHLYILPAVAALAGYAAHWLTVAARRPPVRAAGAALLILALAVPTWEQARLFPYQFVYKNPVAAPVNDRWETDMHWVSAREGIRRVPAGADVWCYTRSTRDLPKDSRPLEIPLCEHRQVTPFAAEQGDNVADAAGDADGLRWVLGRKYRGSPPPQGCVEHDSVTRQLRGEEVILSYVLRCAPHVVDRR